MPQNEIYYESTLDILGKTPSYLIRWGSTISLGVILLLLGLAWWIEYPEILPAPITITPAQPLLKYHTRSTGKVHFIVSNGATIKNVQPLAYIESSTDWQNAQTICKITDTLPTQKAPDWASLRLPIGLRLGEWQNTYNALQEALQQYQTFLNLDSEAKQIYQLRQQIQTYQALHENLKGQKKLQNQELQSQKRTFLRDSALHKQKVLADKEFDKSLADFTQQQRALKNTEASAFDNTLKISQLESKTEEISLAKREREARLRQNVQNAWEGLLSAYKQWKERYVIEANAVGKLHYLKYWEEGQFVREEEPLLAIIPAQSLVRVGKVELSAVRSGKLKIGQKVKIRLADFPPEEYGLLAGTISTVAPLPAIDGQGKEELYMVLVQIPSLQTSYKKQIPASKVQLQGTAHIITENMSLLQRIFYQFRRVWQ